MIYLSNQIWFGIEERRRRSLTLAQGWARQRATLGNQTRVSMQSRKGLPKSARAKTIGLRTPSEFAFEIDLDPRGVAPGWN
jgi:hypothetical protein